MENLTHQDRMYVKLIKLSTIAVFAGRAWQFLFWDAPYRALLWDQPLMEGVVKSLFNMTWTEWASSSTVDTNIQFSIRLTGGLFLVCLIAAFLFNKRNIIFRWPLWMGTIFIFLLAILETKEKFYHIGQFFEHACQVGSPVLLIGIYRGWLTKKSFLQTTKVLIAVTFFCHGLYAINYYPRPGVFVDLMVNTLGTPESFTHQFIFIVGIVDLIVAPLLFIPKTCKAALLYTCIWGFLTAFSRISAGFYWDFPFQSLHQVVHTFVIRLPHGLLPLAAYLFLYPISRKINKRRGKTVKLVH